MNLSNNIAGSSRSSYRVTELVVPSGPINVPDAPSPPKVIATTQSSARIAWDPPIAGYLIEARDNISNSWRQLNGITLFKGTEFTAVNLAENSEVEFRVAAVSEIGQGNFSQPSIVALVREPNGKFMVILSSYLI